MLRRVGGTLVVASMVLVSPAALAQEDEETPPAIDTTQPQHEQAKTYGLWFVRTPAGRIVGVLFGGLVALRVYAAARAHARRKPERRLKSLLDGGRHSEAAELLATDPTRQLEAAETFLRAHRPERAAEIFERAGLNRRAAEAYEHALAHERAARSFERAGVHERAAALYERAGLLKDAERSYLRANDKPSVARLWANAGEHERAARLFTELSMPREAGEHLEQLGRTADAVARYIEAHTQLTRGASRATPHLDDEVRELLRRILDLAGTLKDHEKLRFLPFLQKFQRRRSTRRRESRRRRRERTPA